MTIEPLESRIVLASDLIATVTGFTMPEVMIPGDKGKVSFTIDNIAPAPGGSDPTANDATGTTGFHIYFSKDTTLDIDDEQIGTVSNKSLKLAGDGPGGDVAKFTGSIKLPGVRLSGFAPGPGNYHILVVADSGQRIFETDENNNIGASAAREFAFKFGTIPNGDKTRNVALSGIDENDNPFTLRISGPGFGELVYDPVNIYEPGDDTTDITVRDTDGKSAVKGSFIGTKLRNISVLSPLKSLTFPAAEVTNSALFLDNVEQIFLGNVTDARVQIDATKTIKRITLGRVLDSRLSAEFTGIATLQVVDWNTTPGEISLLETDYIKTLKAGGAPKAGIAGDFSADLEITGGTLPKTIKKTLGTVKIAGSLLGGEWNVKGDVDSIAADAADAWQLSVEKSVKLLSLTGPRQIPGFLTGVVGETTLKAENFDKILVAGRVEKATIVFGNEIGSFEAGSVSASEIRFDPDFLPTADTGFIQRIDVGEWLDGGKIASGEIGKILTDGKKFSGDFTADVTVTTLDEADIQGALRGLSGQRVVWNIDKVKLLAFDFLEHATLAGNSVGALVIGSTSKSGTQFTNSSVTYTEAVAIAINNVDPTVTGAAGIGITVGSFAKYTRYADGVKVIALDEHPTSGLGTGTLDSVGDYKLTGPVQPA